MRNAPDMTPCAARVTARCCPTRCRPGAPRRPRRSTSWRCAGARSKRPTRRLPRNTVDEPCEQRGRVRRGVARPPGRSAEHRLRRFADDRHDRARTCSGSRSRQRFVGACPAPGWDTRYEWKGWLPFEALPQQLKPTRSFVDHGESQDHRCRLSSLHHVGVVCAVSCAAHRGIAPGASQARCGWHAAHPGRRHFDRRTRHARRVARSATAVRQAVVGCSRRLRARPRLGRLDARRCARAALFHAWMRELRTRIFADDLGALAKDFVDGDEMTQALLNVLRGTARSRDWCDDVSTQNRREACADMALDALEAAVARLAKESGRDILALRWGDAHRAVLAHRPLSNVGVSCGGGSSCRDRCRAIRTPSTWGRSRAESSFVTRHAATLRFVADLGDARNTGWILGSGQSGHPLSDHYGDQFTAWSRVESLPIVQGAHAARPIATLMARADETLTYGVLVTRTGLQPIRPARAACSSVRPPSRSRNR